MAAAVAIILPATVDVGGLVVPVAKKLIPFVTILSTLLFSDAVALLSVEPLNKGIQKYALNRE